MNRIAGALAIAALTITGPAVAQDVAGPVAAAVDQFGQSLGESVSSGPGLFVTAQGEARMPAASGAPMTVTITGTGKTAVEAVADRNGQLERIRAVANRFDVAMNVGATTYAIGRPNAWDQAAVVELIEPGGDELPQTDDAPTVTASVPVKLDRPNESRLPGFVDALVAAGVKNLDDHLNGMNLGAMQPFLSLLGLDSARGPGEAVWNQATADGVRKARAQAEAIAEASGRGLGPVRYVSVLMRSHNGENALVSVAVRFSFED